MAKGYIHSIESMGLVDGPGVRCVVFMQGCPLRCQFCHNPDTWHLHSGQEVDAEDLMAKILRFRPYFESSGGGVTFSGGEPLMQKEFLTYLLRCCKDAGIHAAIDTAGGGMGDFSEILELADMILLDVKQIREDAYREITGISPGRYRNFLKQLKEHPVETWVRAVIIPGINDSFEYIQDLWEEVKRIPKVSKIELLPYHVLGIKKYEALGIPYPLQGVPAMDKRKMVVWQEYLDKVLIANK